MAMHMPNLRLENNEILGNNSYQLRHNPRVVCKFDLHALSHLYTYIHYMYAW